MAVTYKQYTSHAFWIIVKNIAKFVYNGVEDGCQLKLATVYFLRKGVS